MIKRIGRLFKSSQDLRGCMVIAGENIESLSQTFMNNDPAHPLHIYQVMHDASQQDLTIQSIGKEKTVIRLNLFLASALKSLIKHIDREGYSIELCIIQPKFRFAENVEALSIDPIEQHWQETGLSAVSVSQSMLEAMLEKQRGTLIFLGAPQYSVDSNDNLLSLSMFASIRALSQSLAREFQPKGIHVVYCMLEQWDAQNLNLMQSVKQICWHVHQQPRSTWSQELSLII